MRSVHFACHQNEKLPDIINAFESHLDPFRFLVSHNSAGSSEFCEVLNSQPKEQLKFLTNIFLSSNQRCILNQVFFILVLFYAFEILSLNLWKLNNSRLISFLHLAVLQGNCQAGVSDKLKCFKNDNPWVERLFLLLIIKSCKLNKLTDTVSPGI